MPSVSYRERTPGTWLVTLELGLDAKGKRIRKHHTVRGGIRKAQKEAARLLAEAEAGNVVVHDRITVAEYLELWLEKHSARYCRPKAHENYAYYIRQHIVPVLGGVRLCKLTVLQLEDYYAEKQVSGRLDGKGGLAPRSVLHHHRTLHTAFEHAIKWGFLTRNPAEHALAPSPVEAEPVVLTEEETAIVLRAAEGTRFYLPVLLAVYMGMRRGEVLGLRWSAIDWAKKRLRVQEAYIKLASGPVFGPAKSHRSKRPVALPEFLLDALLEEKAAQVALQARYGAAYQDQGLVCCHRDGTPWSPDPFGKGFTTWLGKLPVPRITFHELRHSHVSQAIEAGENIKVISARVGHSSAAFTLERYAHVLPGADEGLATRLHERITAAKKAHAAATNADDSGVRPPATPEVAGISPQEMATTRRQDAKTALAGSRQGRKKVLIQARKGRRGRDSNSR